MKISAEYNCDIDWQTTYENLCKILPTEVSEKGTITVYVDHSTVNIFASGKKMQITAPNNEEKKLVFNLIRPYLQPPQQPKPYKAHFDIPWPPPKIFEVAACDKTRLCIILPLSAMALFSSIEFMFVEAMSFVGFVSLAFFCLCLFSVFRAVFERSVDK